MLDLMQPTDTDNKRRYHTQGNNTTDMTRMCPKSPSCNDVATTHPDPDLPPRDDDVPWAIPPPERDSNDGNDDNILAVPTTAPPGPPCLRCHDDDGDVPRVVPPPQHDATIAAQR